MLPRAHLRIFAALSFLSAFSRPHDARAQLRELTQIGIESYPATTSREQPGRGVGTAIGTFSLTVPVLLSKRVILLPGATYERFDLEVEGVGEELGSFHDLSLNLGSIFVFSKRFFAFASVGGGYASEDLDTDRFITKTTLIGMMKVSDSLTLGAGAIYDSQTNGFTPAPLVSINLRFEDDWRLKGVVPAQVDLEYHPTDWLSVGVRQALRSNRYYLDSDKHQISNIDFEFSYFLVSVGPKLTFSPTPFLHFDAYSTLATLRTFEVFRNGRNIGDDRLEAGPMLGIRVWIGPDGWDTEASKSGG